MTASKRTKKSIHFQNPDQIPILFINQDFEKADMLITDVVTHWGGNKKNTSEWGFIWEKHDGTMGQPKDPLANDWDSIPTLKIPNPNDPTRFARSEEIMKKYGDKYYVASLALSGFTIMTFLRGFAATLEGLYVEREKVENLADIVFGFEEQVIKLCKGRGFGAVAFYDDWGTQSGLIISPEMWRDFFKPRYKKQFDLVHENGMDVYFHCCGQISDIIPDLIEIGVDILNLGQPNVFDLKELGRNFSGKTCFLCPISYQTTSLSGTKEEIYAAAKELITNLGTPNGGFIGYVEEYASIGLSDENYNHCINAFRKYGQY